MGFINKGVLAGFQNLTHLELNNNQIISIAMGAFFKLGLLNKPNRPYIDLRNTSLSSLSWNIFVNPDTGPEYLRYLLKHHRVDLDLFGSKFECSRRICWMQHGLRGRSRSFIRFGDGDWNLTMVDKSCPWLDECPSHGKVFALESLHLFDLNITSTVCF